MSDLGLRGGACGCGSACAAARGAAPRAL